jgi:hypothetical protein
LESQSWASLRDTLIQYITDAAPIKNVVYIAIGSVSAVGQVTNTLDDRTKSLFQLAAFVAVIELLKGELSGQKLNLTYGLEAKSQHIAENHQVSIPTIAQEPRFNDLDKQLLK